MVARDNQINIINLSFRRSWNIVYFRHGASWYVRKQENQSLKPRVESSSIASLFLAVFLFLYAGSRRGCCCCCRNRVLPLDYHLRNSLPTKRLAPDKFMTPYTSQGIEDSRDTEDDSCRDQAGCAGDDAKPLDHSHDGIHQGPHIVGGEAADKFIEFGGGRADS